MKAVSAIVTGRVQGVGFRYSTQVVGQRLGLGGWVRNQLDGTVATWAQGPPDQVDAFLAYLEEGPHLAHVTTVEVTPVEPDPKLTSFEVRF